MANSKVQNVIIAVVVLAVAAGLVFWAVSGGDKDTPVIESTDTTQTSEDHSHADHDHEDTAEQPASSERAESAVITFTNAGFNPGTLTVKSGTTVTVKNNSSNRVQFSSDDHPTHTLVPEINLSVLSPGQSATFTAKTVGTHGFHDHIDDSKTGTLIVTE